MRFRGEILKNRIKQALILAILATLAGGRELTAQEPNPNAPPEPAPGNEIVIQGSRWNKALKVRTLPGHITSVNSLVFTKDGKTLISGGSENEGSLRFWSVDSGEEVAEFRSQQTNVEAMAITPDGQTLVTSGPDTIVNLWNLALGKEYRENRTAFLEHSAPVLSVAISPDSNILITGALDGIRVWTLKPRRPLYRLSWIGDPIYAIAFNPDGQIVASGDGDGKVQFWNVKEGTFISEFFPHQEAITGLTFTPDGKLLITASNDSTIKIWDLETGALVHTLVGHTGRVRAIALNPDGRTLASGSNDGIRIWDIFTGDLVGRYYGHKDWVTALAFSPDGRLLASGGLDALVNIWDSGAVEQPKKSEESDEDEPDEEEESDESEDSQ